MSVNEGKVYSLSAYLASSKSRLAKGGDLWKVDQRPTEQILTLPVGMTVRFNHNNKTKLCNVIDKDDLTCLEDI